MEVCGEDLGGVEEVEHGYFEEVVVCEGLGGCFGVLEVVGEALGGGNGREWLKGVEVGGLKSYRGSCGFGGE